MKPRRSRYVTSERRFGTVGDASSRAAEPARANQVSRRKICYAVFAEWSRAPRTIYSRSRSLARSPSTRRHERSTLSAGTAARSEGGPDAAKHHAGRPHRAGGGVFTVEACRRFTAESHRHGHPLHGRRVVAEQAAT